MVPYTFRPADQSESAGGGLRSIWAPNLFEALCLLPDDFSLGSLEVCRGTALAFVRLSADAGPLLGLLPPPEHQAVMMSGGASGPATKSGRRPFGQPAYCPE